MENQEIVWCVYCEREVKTLDAPKSYDNDAWGELAQEHAADCEWVTTRAHTVFTEQDMIENGILPEPVE